MGILKTGLSAISKLFIVAALAGTFIVGMVSVVYLSLSGEEVKVPEIVGKNYLDSEKELANLGLKVKRRALRYSTEKPNTVLEQLPRPGETVKTGQTILVVLSQANPEGEEAPATIVKEEEVETAPDLEIPSDKKKTNKNANVKKATTTRDVEKSNKNTNSNSASDSNSSSSNQSGTGTKSANTATAPANKPTTTATPAKPAAPANSPKPNAAPKPAAAKTPVSGGDVRSRRVN